MAAETSHVELNTRERERLRRLVERLSDDDLRRPVNDHWTVAAVLGHVAFWDSRAAWLADKLARGDPFDDRDHEPEDVAWINDSTRGLIHAIEPREAARFALRQAEETDRRVAALPAEKMYPLDETCPLNAVRASHRREHLDEIEAVLSPR